MTSYYVYLLLCADGSYYTGMTKDLGRRMAEHERGAASTAYTYSRRPVKLVWCEEFPTHDDAFNREHQIKGWSRKKKAALVRNDFDAVHEIVAARRKAREASERYSSTTQRADRSERLEKGTQEK